MKKILFGFAIASLVAATSCNKEDETYSYDDVTLNVKETYQIPKGSGVEWTSSNDFIASVKGDEVTAEVAGTATMSSSRGSFVVTVVPTINYYTEPYLVWGSSKVQVKNFMSSKLGNFALNDEDDDELTYVGSGNVWMYDYEFTDGALDYSYIYVDADAYTAQQMVDYMSQRYTLNNIDESENTIYWVSPDEQTAAMLYAAAIGSGVYWITAYTEYNPTKANGDVRALFKGKKKHLNVDKKRFNELKYAIEANRYAK